MELMENLTITIKYQSTELVGERIKQQDAANYDDLQRLTLKKTIYLTQKVYNT